MRRTAIVTLTVLMLLSMSAQIQAQPEALPPYIYYYSHMLGGLIVERADGSDSRHFATEALPLDLDQNGLRGPGWSPSGRYFAAFGVTYTGQASPPRPHPPTVFDSQGLPVFEWLPYISNPISMHWSPGGEDLLIIFGGYNRTAGLGLFIWLLDVANQKVLADTGVNLNFESLGLGRIDWDLSHDRVVTGIGADLYNWRHYRVTMQLDGTVMKEPITSGETDQGASPPSNENVGTITETDISLWGISTSPSGLFEIYHDEITNTVTGEIITLPIHSQSTICRKYLWSPDERYIIVLSGTLRAGGGCGGALIGITDNRGELWRELGSCYWDEPACVGWLPPAVDVASLPPGQPDSVLLEPVRFDPEQYQEIMVHDTAFLGICQEDNRVAVVDRATNETHFTLLNMPCPFADSRPIEWRSIQAAYLESHGLLATFSDSYVHIWRSTEDGFVDVLRLNAEGYELEFTEDGQYLRARNVHAWKVYSVAEILAAIQAEEVDEPSPP